MAYSLDFLKGRGWMGSVTPALNGELHVKAKYTGIKDKPSGHPDRVLSMVYDVCLYFG